MYYFNSRLLAATLLASATILTACSSDDDATDSTPHRPITVVIDDATRASVTTTKSLSSFKLYGKNTDFTFNKSGSDWVASPVNEWPSAATDDEMVNFYAYSLGTFNATDKTLEFTVNEDAFNQHDLIVATNQLSYNGCGGRVHLVFDHICTAVDFTFYMTNTLSTALNGSTLTVKSVVLSNIKSYGTYNFLTDSWTLGTKTSNYTLTNSDLTATTSQQALPCGYLFMIPQTFDNESQAAVKVTYKIGEGAEKVTTLPLNGITWEKNSNHSIPIKLTTSNIQVNP